VEQQLSVAARNAAFEERIQAMAKSVQQRVRYHTIELPDGSELRGLQSVEHLRHRLDLFQLPQDLSGKRVLDVGAWDGWFTFECERRGASVVAVDCVELETFHEAHRLLKSRAEYLILDVNELSAARLGTFDIVLFFGVLYHLRHPLLGLERVVELCTDTALIESFVINGEHRAVPAVMEFYERAELGGQIDNWCGPSPECLLAMCRSAGFATAELLDITSNRASVLCRRRWPEPGDSPAPHLNSAVNNRTYIATFHPLKDEYICCYFQSPQPELTVDSVFVEIDGYGVAPLSVNVTGERAWQANCVRPASLTPGVHVVTIRTMDSARSNAVEFTMLDAEGNAPPAPARELPAHAPELCSVELHPPADLRMTAGRFGSLVCYFRSAAEVLGARDITIDTGVSRLQADTVSSLGNGVWQANVFLSEPLDSREGICLRLGARAWSQRGTVDVR